MSLTPMQTALWANDIQRACLLEAGDDVDAGLTAAEYILSTQLVPSEIRLIPEVKPSPTPVPTEPEPQVYLAHDIHNRRAQGILNRSVQAVKGLSSAAREELSVALRRGVLGSGEAILKFVDKYRVQLARLLTATQLAAVLEGAQEVATKVPVLATFPGAVTPPPTLEPEQAIALVDRLEKLTGEERARAFYNLPTEQQTYARQAVAAKEASPPIRPPTFTPPAPPAGSPEEVHFPVIEEAVKSLAEKNILTRDRYDALDAAARAKAFTVANVSAEETLTKIRDSLAENVKEGVDYETWREKVLDDVDQGTFMSDAHQETVFRNNIQSALSDGQEAVLSHPLVRSGFPYRARDAIHDERARKNHIALEEMGIQGTNIYRADDPVWQLFRVPWDYNDRCSDTPITVRHAAERGIEEAQEWLRTGVEPTQKAHVPIPPFQPPPGFRRAVASLPLSVQLSMQPMATMLKYPTDFDQYFTEQHKEPGPPLPIEEYPRDNANRFLDKYVLSRASREQDTATALRDSIPEDQRWKLDRAIAHLQSGGTIHHPKEPLGLAININGTVVDHDWREYSIFTSIREEWEGRQARRDEYRAAADEAVRAMRSEGKDLSESDAHLRAAGATEAEMRTLSRVRHLVDVGRREPGALNDAYEDTAEAAHRRIDASYETDPEVPIPEEPSSRTNDGVKFALEGEQSPDPTDPEINERLDLISGVLVLLFGDDSVRIAKKLKADAVRRRKDRSATGSISLSMDPNGIWHGTTPPTPSGWVQIQPGPRGGLRWAPTGSAYATGAPPPASSAFPPGATATGTAHAQAHTSRLANATSHYDGSMATLLAGGTLSPTQKVNLAPSLSVMNKGQLKSLYAALGGTAAITGAQRQPWVHAIKAILSGQPVPTRSTTPAPAVAARGPAPTTATVPAATGAVNATYTQAAPAAPVQDEITWKTGKAQPGGLNGIDFGPAPPKFWEGVKDADVNEPPPLRRVDRVSVLIREPDGRIWIVEPTNHYGNRKHTLPGGGVEAGLTNQQNAMKEVWEETGLQVKITGFAGDFEDSNTAKNGRLYIGERVGGAPWDAKVEPNIPKHFAPGVGAAESETVKLVTPDRAAQLLHRTDDLAQLAMVHPIPVDTKPNRNVIKKIVDAVQPKARAYIKKKLAAGESPGDATLHVIQEARGFNGKPKVVNKANFDILMAQGQHIEMLRGIAQTPPSSAHTLSKLTPKQMADQFRSGEHFPGNGMFGVGTYADSTKGHANAATYQYSYRGEIIRMALPKTAKVAKFTELNRLTQSHPDNYEVPPGKNKTHYWRGVHAALAGYDAIHVDGLGYGQGYYVILNRSILVVQDTEPRSGYTIR